MRAEELEADPSKKAPKSFVMRSGALGRSVTALVKDVRRMMEPNTASILRVGYRFQLLVILS